MSRALVLAALLGLAALAAANSAVGPRPTTEGEMALGRQLGRRGGPCKGGLAGGVAQRPLGSAALPALRFRGAVRPMRGGRAGRRDRARGGPRRGALPAPASRPTARRPPRLPAPPDLVRRSESGSRALLGGKRKIKLEEVPGPRDTDDKCKEWKVGTATGERGGRPGPAGASPGPS